MAEKRDASIWVSELGEKITIGADPEFVLVKEDGSALYADELFVINGNDDNKWEQLGSDGPCAEIRPEPSNNHEELIQNIEKLFKEHSDVIKDYNWMGGATYSHPSMDRRYPIGGHIHLGIPNLNMSNADLSASQIK